MNARKVMALLGAGLLLALIAGLVTLWAPEPRCRIARWQWKGIPPWSGGSCRLEPGKPLRAVFREYAPQSPQVYGLSLEAGKLLALTIDQDELDVAVTLLSPEYKELLEVDSPPGGPEHLYFIAPQR